MITEDILLDFMRETAYKPMTYQELEEHFQIRDASEFKAFLKLLNELEQQGTIVLTRTQRYGMPERMDLLRGRLQVHAKGFAFLIPEDREHPDVYIHANDLKSAMNGDIVLVRVNSKGPDGGRLEGEVVRIVTRAVTQVVGVFQHNETFGFVIPDDKRINRDIFVPAEKMGSAATGDKVVARIVTYPEGRSAATGEVIEILGHKDDPGVDILSIIRKHQLPEAFPDDVMEEAAAAPDTIDQAEIVRQGRRDLRDKVIVTIDGEDAKDLDDAVNVERLPNGNYRLGVHIADVGYYVRENSRLDQEAYNRGCSVYLVDRVIPMLPHRLSNGICSLNPQVDRFTLSCEMEFDDHMKVVKHDIFTSVIRTKERMTYTNVRKILQEEDPEVTERYSDLVDTFKEMRELAMRLRSNRMQRGAVDFDFDEAKVIVDDSGKAVDIVKRERSIAEQIIEEFMLAANETVAEHFHWLKVPFIYRIHEDPDPEKLMNFMAFIANFGYSIHGKGNKVHPRALQTLLEDIDGTKEETVISTMLLRSMKQAKYDAESTGHFGLAAEYYTHFTSPIRRYPDLVIHRIIREVIEAGGVLPEDRQEYLASRMGDIAQQSSERERLAVEAERDTEQLKKAEFMLDKVGEEFSGIISSVTSFGMFIELDNTVEGLIRLSAMTDDYYHFHEQHMALIGERTSKIYRLGDEVKIRVARVNMDEHTIDFEMVDMKPRRREGGPQGGFGGNGRGSRGKGKGRGEKDRGEKGRESVALFAGDSKNGGRKQRGGEAEGRGKRGKKAESVSVESGKGKKKRRGDVQGVFAPPGADARSGPAGSAGAAPAVEAGREAGPDGRGAGLEGPGRAAGAGVSGRGAGPDWSGNGAGADGRGRRGRGRTSGDAGAGFATDRGEAFAGAAIDGGASGRGAASEGSDGWVFGGREASAGARGAAGAGFSGADADFSRADAGFGSANADFGGANAGFSGANAGYGGADAGLGDEDAGIGSANAGFDSAASGAAAAEAGRRGRAAGAIRLGARGENQPDQASESGGYGAEGGRNAGDRVGVGAAPRSASFGFGSGKGGYSSGSPAGYSRDNGSYKSGGGERGSRRKKTSASGILIGNKENGGSDVGNGIVGDPKRKNKGKKGSGKKAKDGDPGKGASKVKDVANNATAAFVRKKKK